MLHDSGWKYALSLTVLVLVVTSLPYTFAYLSAPDDRMFVGIQLNMVDHQQYFSWMRAHESSFLISNRMTPEPNAPVFFNLLWWALAQVARLTGWDYAAVYQLFRWAAGLIFGLVAYGFCRLFVEDRRKRLLAFLLILFASGLGWILVVQKYLAGSEGVPYPLALYIVEANSFLSILGFPHFVIAAAHIVAVFGLFLLALTRRQLRWAALAGAVALSLGLQHAYDLITIYAVVGALVLALMWRERRLLWFEIRAAALLGVISVGPPAYFFLITVVDPVWSEILDQFTYSGTWSPDPIRLVILLGALSLLALAGFYVRLRQSQRSPAASALFRLWAAATVILVAATVVVSLVQPSPGPAGASPAKALAFLVLFVIAAGLVVDLAQSRPDEPVAFLLVKTWAVVHLLIIYIPLEFQIHLLNPWQIPLSLLAVNFWLDRVVPWVRARQPRFGSPRVMGALLLLAVIPTNLYLFAWRFVDLRRYDYPYFIYKDDAAALQWLRENATENEVVLSSEMIGQFIPSWTRDIAFIAHYAMTLDYFDKQALVARFFDRNTDDAWREQLLREYGIRYIYYGENERALGAYDPEESAMLDRVVSWPRVIVYRVSALALR